METYWVLRDGAIECRVASVASAPVAAAMATPQGGQTVRHGAQGLRLTRRGRALVAGLSIAFTVPVLSAGAVAAASSPPPSAQLVTYTVAAGESLWTIAEHCKAPGTDTRDEVVRIKKINHMATADLYAGQVILVDPAS